MGTFELFRDEDRELCFRLRSAKGNILLTSEGYAGRAEVEDGISQAKALAPGAMNYERKRTDAGHSFMLQTYDGEVVATSEMYPTTAARDKAIEAVKHEAPGAEVIEPAEPG